VDIPVDRTSAPNEACELVAVATLVRSGSLTIELHGRQS
jgi:hypothetical protein